MTIKTFPLQFTEDELDKITAAARAQGKTTKQFIFEAIEEKVRRGVNNGKID